MFSLVSQNMALNTSFLTKPVQIATESLNLQRISKDQGRQPLIFENSYEIQQFGCYLQRFCPKAGVRSHILSYQRKHEKPAQIEYGSGTIFDRKSYSILWSTMVRFWDPTRTPTVINIGSRIHLFFACHFKTPAFGHNLCKQQVNC